jgi:hypothetical protein
MEYHTSEHLTKIVLDMTETAALDIKICRSQSFDNAASMSGKYSGLQTRPKNEMLPLTR